MRVLPCGDRAALVEAADAAERRRIAAALRALALPGCVDLVPAAVTVLARFDSAQALADALPVLESLDPAAAPEPEPLSPLVIPVRYDGDDLADVAQLLHKSPDEVVAWHTGQVWTVDFVGFLPGFGYLVGDPGNPSVPRRSTPRTRIPAGAVGLAGSYSGVYPHPSPGGWQIIGTTDAMLWDVNAQYPAAFRPGREVRFEAVDHG